MIPEIFKCYKSYSRYGDVRFDYDLLDDFFARIVEGNLICTDSEQDISCDGNICLVTPNGDVLHIGGVPIAEIGTVKFSFDKDENLHMQYKVAYDNDHHHTEIMDEVVDTHMTEERFLDMMVEKLYRNLKKNVKPKTSGSLRNTLNIYVVKSKGIFLCGSKRIAGRCKISERYYAKQLISFNETSKKFELLPEEDGGNRILDIVSDRNKIAQAIEEINKNF